MIGYLQGVILEKKTDRVLLLVAQVGYEVEVPAGTLCALPKPGESCNLYISTYVREDAFRLFGFANAFDKAVFECLIQVSGVGPRAACVLLSVLDGTQLCQAIVHQQTHRLTAIPGVGAKTADRLVLELKTKLQKLLAREQDASEAQGGADAPTRKGALAQKEYDENNILDDLKSALANLGYKDKQIHQAISSVTKQMEKAQSFSFEDALKYTLKQFSEHVFKTA